MIHDNPWSLVSSDVIRIYQNIVLLYYLVRSCAILIYFILSSAVPGLFGSSTIWKMACSVAVWFDAVCICLDFINAYLKVTVVMCFCRLLETSPAATCIFLLGQKVPWIIHGSPWYPQMCSEYIRMHNDDISQQ